MEANEGPAEPVADEEIGPQARKSFGPAVSLRRLTAQPDPGLMHDEWPLYSNSAIDFIIACDLILSVIEVIITLFLFMHYYRIKLHNLQRICLNELSNLKWKFRIFSVLFRLGRCHSDTSA